MVHTQAKQMQEKSGARSSAVSRIEELFEQIKAEKLGMSILVFILGIALLRAGAKGLVDSTAILNAGQTLYTSIVTVVAFAVCVLAFGRRVPSTRMTFLVIVLCALIFASGVVIAPLTNDSMLVDIALFSTATFFGIGQALLVLFFTYVISRFGPWQAAVFFGVIELLTNVFVLVLMNVRPVAFRPVLAVFTGVGFVLVAGALFLGFVRNETFVAYDRGARTPQADSESHTRYGVEWAVFLSMTFVVSTIYGLSSKASAVTCSPFGTYDIYTGVILLMANLILIIYLVYTGKNGSLLTPFIVVSVCYVLGFSIFAYTCDNVNPLGAALIRAGYNLSYVLVLAYLARLAWATPQKTYRYFALVSMCATPLVGEVVGNTVMASGIPNETILYNVSQLSIILVALMAVGLVFGGFSFALVLSGKQDIEAPYEAFGRVLLRHTQRVSAPVTDASAEGEAVASVRDTPATQIAAFAKEYSLTQREVDVLTETLRGLTRTNVAKKLCVSPETVKGHLASIYRKAGVSSRQELIELLDSRF